MSTLVSETETLSALRKAEQRILDDQQYLSSMGHTLKNVGSEVYISNRYYSAANQLSRALMSIQERIANLTRQNDE